MEWGDLNLELSLCPTLTDDNIEDAVPYGWHQLLRIYRESDDRVLHRNSIKHDLNFGGGRLRTVTWSSRRRRFLASEGCREREGLRRCFERAGSRDGSPVLVKVYIVNYVRADASFALGRPPSHGPYSPPCHASLTPSGQKLYGGGSCRFGCSAEYSGAELTPSVTGER